MSTPYALLLLELKSTIRDARYRAVRQVNRALIELYWDIGRRLHLRWPSIPANAEQRLPHRPALFNRKLRALVAVELKTEPFKPSFVGTLNFHLEIMDDQVRMPGENPSIGILLCSEKDDLEVEYALRAASRPMGVVNYQTETDLPEDLAKYLPSPTQLRQQIEVVKQEFYREGNK